MEVNNAFSLPASAEVKILRFQPSPADHGLSVTTPIPTEEASGLILLRKGELEEILSSQVSTNSRLTEALQRVDELQAKLDEKELSGLTSPSSTSSNSNDELMHAFLELSKDHRQLAEKLNVAQNELQSTQKKNEALQAELTAFNYDWDSLLSEYNRIKPQARLSNTYKKYFANKISEVYHAHAQLREPALRPKVPPGCLNCGKLGHSHRSCSTQYNGKFCQECACTEFSTQDCPWPHFVNAMPSLPEHLKCRRCLSPRNQPDPHCSLCRQHIISKATATRKQIALEIEAEHRNVRLTGTFVQQSTSSGKNVGRPPTFENSPSTDSSDSSSEDTVSSNSTLTTALPTAKELKVDTPKDTKKKNKPYKSQPLESTKKDDNRPAAS